MSQLIFELIPKIMGEVGAIGKNGINTFDKYKFRSIDDVYNKVQPVLASNGVFFKPNVLESSESKFESAKGTPQIRVKQKVEYTFYAKDGSSFTTVVEGEAIDRGDKATNKAMTAALKYMLIQVLCIAIEGQDDADSESPDVGKRDEKPQPPRNPLAKPKSLADYVLPSGKYSKKKLSEVNAMDLHQYVQDIKDHFSKIGEELKGQSKEMVETIEAYLSKIELELIDSTLDLDEALK
jgi:hypothetical protein